MASQGRDAWIALGSTLTSVGAAGGVVSTTAVYAPHASSPLWLPIGSAIVFGVGLYIIVALAVGFRLPGVRMVHEPPGGGIPIVPPLRYQVIQLRQAIAKLAETGAFDMFTEWELHQIMLNHPRTGTDPVYEPLHAGSCRSGLMALVQLGELEEVSPMHYRVARRATRGRGRFRRLSPGSSSG